MITGFTIIRNAIELDFCLELCVESMLGVCEQVWVCDSDSTDGTGEMLREWATREPRLRVINRPWTDPVGHPGWIVEWMQWTQGHLLREGHHLYLDADEVLDESAYPVLREANPEDCFWFHRVNYWRDVKHTAPYGTVCSHIVARFGPHDLPMHSDEMHDGVHFPLGEPEMRQRAVKDDRLVIHHYGFLRKREALFRKIEGNLRAFFGAGQDERIKKAMEDGSRHWTEFCPFERPLLKWRGEQPQRALDWLKERGAL